MFEKKHVVAGGESGIQICLIKRKIGFLFQKSRTDIELDEHLSLFKGFITTLRRSFDLGQTRSWPILFADKYKFKGRGPFYDYEEDGWAGKNGEMLWVLMECMFGDQNVHRKRVAPFFNEFDVKFEGLTVTMQACDIWTNGTGGTAENMSVGGGLRIITLENPQSKASGVQARIIDHMVQYLQTKLPELNDNLTAYIRYGKARKVARQALGDGDFIHPTIHRGIK